MVPWCTSKALAMDRQLSPGSQALEDRNAALVERLCLGVVPLRTVDAGQPGHRGGELSVLLTMLLARLRNIALRYPAAALWVRLVRPDSRLSTQTITLQAGQSVG